MSKKRLTSFLLLLTALTGFPSFNARAEGPLRLALKAIHTGELMRPRIMDVADVGTSQELLDRYGKVVIKNVSADGTLLASNVFTALGREGADLSKVELTSPGEQRVRPSPEMEVILLIRQEIIRQATEKYQCAPEAVTVELSTVPSGLPAKKDIDQVEVEPSVDGFQVSFLRRDKTTLKTVSIVGTVAVVGSVVVARRALMPSQYVTAEDFTEEKRPIEATVGAMQRLADLQGKETHWQMTQGLESGAPLKREDIQQAVTLQKGGIVSLVMKTPSFQVRTIGRIKDVMDNGASVLVENVESKKEVMARPLNANEVEVLY